MHPRTVMILQPLCSDGIVTTTSASGVEVLFCAGFLGEPRRGRCHLHPPGMWDNGTLALHPKEWRTLGHLLASLTPVAWTRHTVSVPRQESC